jgi:hypothetical protein
LAMFFVTAALASRGAAAVTKQPEVSKPAPVGLHSA